MNKKIKYSLLVICLAIIGFSIYYFVGKDNKDATHNHSEDIYTCPMHPEIIRNEPGSCPICGMDLVKKEIEAMAIESHSFEHLLESADYFVAGDFKTITPKDTVFNSLISMPGVVTYDPNSSVAISARISGRIEKMYVHYKFQKVTKGQKLFDLYSPELLTEQQNLIYLLANDGSNVTLINALKQKLALYGMSNNQINALAIAKKVNPVISIYSPAHGIVIGTESMLASMEGGMQKTNVTTENLNLKEGDYITKNTAVFNVVNNQKVWAVFNIIQGYNSVIKENQPIQITSEMDPDAVIDAKVNFVATQLDANEKTNRVRVYLNNEKLQFPVGLRLQGAITSQSVSALWLPKSSMVSLGKKKITFIKKEYGFQTVEVKTGMEMNGFVQLLEGVSVTDTLVANAQYLIDSGSFIKIK